MLPRQTLPAFPEATTAVGLSGVCAVCRLVSRSEAAEGRTVPTGGGNLDGSYIGYPETFFRQIIFGYFGLILSYGLPFGSTQAYPQRHPSDRLCDHPGALRQLV